MNNSKDGLYIVTTKTDSILLFSDKGDLNNKINKLKNKTPCYDKVFPLAFMLKRNGLFVRAGLINNDLTIKQIMQIVDGE